MDAVSVTILSEAERVGGARKILVIGEPSEDVITGLQPTPIVQKARDILAGSSETVPRADLVICLPDSVESELQRRALALAVAEAASHVVISVQRLGEELPLPLIELKRGLLLESADLGFRVYGKREEQQ